MKSIARAFSRRAQERVEVESASIVGAASLGSTGLYSVRRKTGEILDGISGPAGLVAGSAVSLGFKDTGQAMRYTPFIIGEAVKKAGQEDVVAVQGTSFSPRTRDPIFWVQGASGPQVQYPTLGWDEENRRLLLFVPTSMQTEYPLLGYGGANYFESNHFIETATANVYQDEFDDWYYDYSWHYVHSRPFYTPVLSFSYDPPQIVYTYNQNILEDLSGVDYARSAGSTGAHVWSESLDMHTPYVGEETIDTSYWRGVWNNPGNGYIQVSLPRSPFDFSAGASAAIVPGAPPYVPPTAFPGWNNYFSYLPPYTNYHVFQDEQLVIYGDVWECAPQDITLLGFMSQGWVKVQSEVARSDFSSLYDTGGITLGFDHTSTVVGAASSLVMTPPTDMAPSNWQYPWNYTVSTYEDTTAYTYCLDDNGRWLNFAFGGVLGGGMGAKEFWLYEEA